MALTSMQCASTFHCPKLRSVSFLSAHFPFQHQPWFSSVSSPHGTLPPTPSLCCPQLQRNRNLQTAVRNKASPPAIPEMTAPVHLFLMFSNPGTSLPQTTCPFPPWHPAARWAERRHECFLYPYLFIRVLLWSLPKHYLSTTSNQRLAQAEKGLILQENK